MSFPASEAPTKPETGRHRISTALIWWRKGESVPWIVRRSNGTYLACMRWRAIAGHVSAKSIHMGDGPPADAPGGTPAGWLEVMGELILDGAIEL